MLKIIPDTNTLLAISQFKIDLFSEIKKIVDAPFEICVQSNIIEELEKLINKGKLTDRKAAKFAVQLLKTKNIKTIKTEIHNVDDSLCKLDPKKYVVITQDQELKKRLRKQGVNILTIRQKKHLIWELKNVL